MEEGTSLIISSFYQNLMSISFNQLFGVDDEYNLGGKSVEVHMLDYCARLSSGAFKTSDIACILYLMNLTQALSSPALTTMGEAAGVIQGMSKLVTSAALVPALQASLPNVSARALRVLGEESAAAVGVASLATPTAGGSTAEALERELSLEHQFVKGLGKGGVVLFREEHRATPLTQALRASVLDGLEELKAELENVKEGLKPFTSDCLRPGEVVLTSGECPNLCDFLDFYLRGTSAALAAAAATEGEGEGSSTTPLPPTPHLLWVQQQQRGGFSGERVAALATKYKGKCTVTGVPHAGVWGVLGGGLGVRKLVLPALAVARDGGALVDAGCLGLALEAQARGLPVVLVVSAARLAPVASVGELWGVVSRGSSGGATLQGPPAQVIPLELAASVGACGPLAAAHLPAPPAVSIRNALFDTLPPSLVSLVVTSAGSAAPSGVWRLTCDAFPGL